MNHHHHHHHPPPPTVRDTYPIPHPDSLFGVGVVEWFIPERGGFGRMKPALDESRVFFLRNPVMDAGGGIVRSAEIVALDRLTGRELWKAPLASRPNRTIAESAVIAGDNVTAAGPSLQTFDRETGAPLGHIAYEPATFTRSAATDGAALYAPSWNGHVLSVNPITGAVNWDTPLAAGSTAVALGVAVSGDVVAVTLSYNGGRIAMEDPQRDSGIVAVLSRTGTVRWRVAVPAVYKNAAIIEAPLIVGDLVIVQTVGHEVFALDIRSGAVVWSADESRGHPEWANNGVAACDGNVVVLTGDMGVTSLVASTGAERWHRGEVTGGSRFGLQCSHGRIMVPERDLHTFRADDGSRITHGHRYDSSDFFVTGAVRDDQFIYIATTYGFAKVRVP